MKSRNLTNEEFIKILQLEYLSHRLRAIIYETAYFKKVSSDIAEKKKEKILNLANNFHLLNIFDSDAALEFFWRNLFLNEFGKPNFQVRPDLKKSVSYWDSFYLFQKGQVVSCKSDPTKNYYILKNCPEKEFCTLQKSGGLVRVPYKDLKVHLLYTISIDVLR